MSSCTLEDPRMPNIQAIDLIYSCNICHHTLDEIYNKNEDESGLKNGVQEGDDKITRSWLASCGHFFCGRHLEGGGVPFHPHDQRPTAVCPICEKSVNDNAPKTIYSVRGFDRKSHDSALPDSFFVVPPKSLDKDGPGMDALKFQFTSLVRTGIANTIQLHTERSRRADAELQLAKSQKSVVALQAVIRDNEQHIKQLEVGQRKLQKWEEQKPKLTEYINLVAPMEHEITVLRKCLQKLGYQTPTRQYKVEITKQDIQPEDPRDPIQKALDDLSAGNIEQAKESERSIEGSYDETSMQERKRKREPERHEPIQVRIGAELARPNPMPPPKIPASRSPQRSPQRVVQSRNTLHEDVLESGHVNLEFPEHDISCRYQMPPGHDNAAQKFAFQDNARLDAGVQSGAHTTPVNNLNQSFYHNQGQLPFSDGRPHGSARLDHFVDPNESLMDQYGYQDRPPNLQARGEKVQQPSMYQQQQFEELHRPPRNGGSTDSRTAYTVTSSPRKLPSRRQGTATSVASPFFRRPTIPEYRGPPQPLAIRKPVLTEPNYPARISTAQGPVNYQRQKTTNGLSFIPEPESIVNGSEYSEYGDPEPTIAQMRPRGPEQSLAYQTGQRNFGPPPQTPRNQDIGKVPSLPSVQPSLHKPYTTPSQSRHGMTQQSLSTIRGVKAGGFSMHAVPSARPTPIITKQHNIWSSGGGRRAMR